METSDESEFVTLSIKDNILFVEFKAQVFLNCEAAKKITEVRIKFQNEKYLPTLYNLTGIIDSDKAGRDYLSKNSCLFSKAIALYAGSLVSTTIAKFYIRHITASVPCDLFTSLPSALQFLKLYK